MEVDEVSVGEKVDSSEEISRKSDGSQRVKELNEQQVQLEMDLTLNQVSEEMNNFGANFFLVNG